MANHKAAKPPSLETDLFASFANEPIVYEPVTQTISTPTIEVEKLRSPKQASSVLYIPTHAPILDEVTGGFRMGAVTYYSANAAVDLPTFCGLQAGVVQVSLDAQPQSSNNTLYDIPSGQWGELSDSWGVPSSRHVGFINCGGSHDSDAFDLIDGFGGLKVARMWDGIKYREYPQHEYELEDVYDKIHHSLVAGDALFFVNPWKVLESPKAQEDFVGFVAYAAEDLGLAVIITSEEDYPSKTFSDLPESWDAYQLEGTYNGELWIEGRNLPRSKLQDGVTLAIEHPEIERPIVAGFSE